MALDFPADPGAQTPVNEFSPTSTPYASTNGGTYKWDGNKWTGEVIVQPFSIISENAPYAEPGDMWWSTLDGRLYVKYKDDDSEQWVDASPSVGKVHIDDVAGGIPDAPTDGEYYTRRNATWDPISILGEAPEDNKYYARKDGAWEEIPRDVVSVKDFGAVGDGVTDDTAAIQAALDTTALGVYFPPGLYRIEGAPFEPAGGWTLQSTVDHRKIWGDSAWITADNPIDKAFKIFGDHNEFSLNCTGKNNIAIFVEMEAAHPYVHNCVIQDLKAIPGKVIAIQIDTNGHYTITDNIIQNLEAIGDGDFGNGVGMARAIAVTINDTVNVNKPSLIANNSIDNIIGEEGDAIVVQSNTEGNYFNLNTLITGNTIHNFNRRGIKIQGDQVRVISNNFFNSWSSRPATPQTVIDMNAGEDHVVAYNNIANCEWFTQIKIFEDRNGEKVNNCVVVGNIITKLGSAHDTSIMFFNTNGGDGLTVKDNAIDCPGCTTTAIGVRDTRNVIVSGNTAIHDGPFISVENCTNVGQNYNLSIVDL